MTVAPASRFSAPRFGGYAACPIRRLYLQPYNRQDLMTADELSAVGKREGFKVLIQAGPALYAQTGGIPGSIYNDNVWAQDHKFFQKTPTGPVLKSLAMIYPHHERTVRQLGAALQRPVVPAGTPLEGGNFFLGKRADGSPYALVGRKSLENTAWMNCLRQFGIKGYVDIESLLWWKRRRVKAAYKEQQSHHLQTAHRLIASDLGLKPEQVHFVSQPDFHIDLAVRPLSGNKVLLADPALSFKLLRQALREAPNEETKVELNHLWRSLQEYEAFRHQSGYANTETMQRELQQAGFQVVRIPANFKLRNGRYDELPRSQRYRCASFANALVHERPNGDLVYITNRSYLPLLNRLFEEELRRGVPEIKAVDWIGGQEFPLGKTPFKSNRVSDWLDYGGGIHCQTAEEPDFDRWDPTNRSSTPAD